MWHMIVTCPNESVKIVTVEVMYEQCGLVCQFQLSVHTDSPEEHRLLVLCITANGKIIFCYVCCNALVCM